MISVNDFLPVGGKMIMFPWLIDVGKWSISLGCHYGMFCDIKVVTWIFKVEPIMFILSSIGDVSVNMMYFIYHICMYQYQPPGLMYLKYLHP